MWVVGECKETVREPSKKKVEDSNKIRSGISLLGLSASLLSGVQYAKIPPLFVGQLGVGVRGGEYIFFYFISWFRAYALL